MIPVEVLKFGSSVLRSPGDLHIGVDEIYRRWRAGYRVLAVVSAFAGSTDELLGEVADTVGTECPEATAAYVSTGEQKTAALLLGSLRQYGLPARLITPREIGFIAEGPTLESAPVRVDTRALEKLWPIYPILVLPGFYAVDEEGRTTLFGRGGSDMSALFLASALGAGCRLLKDMPGVFDADPASSAHAHRFSALSWEKAIEVAGPLIQPNALHFALERALAFEVGRPNEASGTAVGHFRDEWSPPAIQRPLRIALAGCGVVGRGVYETVKRYPQAFEISHVIVREAGKYPGVDHLTTDSALALEEGVDVVIVCFPGTYLASLLIDSALSMGKFVITPNKAAVAAHGGSLALNARGDDRRLWYSAAVGGAMPALEMLARLKTPVREIRGIINSTCGVVLDAWAEGRTLHDAIVLAQVRGFAEADPARDLSGRDSADKLSLLVQGAFGEWIDPEKLPTQGIDTVMVDPTGCKLIARATRTAEGIVATVGPESPAPGSFLGQAKGPENRLEIELAGGEVIRLRAQGAGRWPTTVSIMGDLHEVARHLERLRTGSPINHAPACV
jgi:homoserine dehydrogenase